MSENVQDSTEQKLRNALEEIVRRSEECFAREAHSDSDSVRDHESGRRLSYSVCAGIARKALAPPDPDTTPRQALSRIDAVSEFDPSRPVPVKSIP